VWRNAGRGTEDKEKFQFDTSFSSSPGQDFSTILRAHTASETVLVCSFSFRRLIRPFHDSNPLIPYKRATKVQFNQKFPNHAEKNISYSWISEIPH
jgi:hypothetical protein